MLNPTRLSLRMQWPEAFYQRVLSRLGLEAASFFTVLDTEPVTAVNLHPLKFNAPLTLAQTPWNPYGRILSERPAFFLDPWWHAGAYYPQESGSQLLAAVLEQLPVPEEPIMLDLCAAPGGKSVLISNFLQGRGALLSNEVIRKRVPVLYENLARNGFANNAISNLDPKELGSCTELFDLIFVDAPCSGEGMFRKHAHASEQWSPELVEFCALRQQRILNDIWPALKPGGFLVYSTCTLNETENEDNLRFLLQQADALPVELTFPESWGLERGSAPTACWYSWPHKTGSEGFFLGIVQKKPSDDNTSPGKPLRTAKLNHPLVWLSETAPQAHVFPQQAPALMNNALATLVPALGKFQEGIIVAGTPLGVWIGNKFRPAPEFALSVHLRRETTLALNLTEAVSFLCGMGVLPEAEAPGWYPVAYEGLGLGWINHLGKRSNNVLPQSWRIRQRPTGPVPTPFWQQ
jgi:16S rRNA C967 or C1407 C5-methylase (RsmB/RsmF family)/NOL1/NOP2/fmu family ribosome biogenesis protein